MKKYLAELIGTFCLVFCGTGAIIVNEVGHGSVTHLGVCVAFGLIVMIMIYSIGEVSGSHINPAVSFAFFTQNEMTLAEFLKYTASQTAGALLASLSFHLLFPNSINLGSTHPSGSEMQSFIIEIFLAALLMFVVGRISTTHKYLTGIVVGGVITLEALFAGPITGASMNPARSLGPAIVSGNYQGIWIYLTAPFIGAYLGIKLNKWITS